MSCSDEINPIKFKCSDVVGESWQDYKIRQLEQDEHSIEMFNKKYTDKGETPPLYEKIDYPDCTVYHYPNGKMEIWMKHRLPRFELFNQAYKDSEKPQQESTS